MEDAGFDEDTDFDHPDHEVEKNTKKHEDEAIVAEDKDKPDAAIKTNNMSN